MDDGAVAGLAIFGIFVMPVAGWIVVRYLSHRERMEMIRHGIAPNVKMRGSDWRNAAMSGPDVGLDPGANRGRRNEPDFTLAGQQIELRKGIRLTCIGFALTLGLSFIGYSSNDGPTIHPGPWLLGGLIPMFIGLAQVASVLLSRGLAGGSFGPRGPMPQAPFVEPPFAAPPPSSSYGVPPTYDSSYTYRPGDTQELRPPPAPPERR